jgi:glutamate dehydrogenase
MILSYSKIALSNQLIASDVPEDPYLSGELDRYFPDRLSRRYADLLGEHRLKREIIVTATTNSIVNRMGPTFVARTQQDTGADAATVARAYSIARESFDVRELWTGIERLDTRVAAATQYGMTQDTVALIRQATYWLIQRHRGALGIEAQVGRLRPGIRELTAALPHGLHGLERADYDRRHAELTAAGVPTSLARHVASLSALASAPDIVELAEAHRLAVAVAARIYFEVGADFGLDWLRNRIEELVIQGHWQAVARNSLRETLYDAHRGLTEQVLRGTRERDPARAVEAWRARHAAAAGHARGIVEDIRAQPATADFASLSVALQALHRLADAGK